MEMLMDAPHDPVSHKPQDDRLGMSDPISRRDFVNGVLLASAGVLLNGHMPATISPSRADAWNG